MPTTEKTIRQSVTLPPRVAKRVKSLAKSRRTSASRVLVELVESGLEAVDREKQHFLDLAERLAQSKDPAEQARLKDELARLTFGD
jgi:predicted DNA-binding protein